jgi:hypothetical protein
MFRKRLRDAEPTDLLVLALPVLEAARVLASTSETSCLEMIPAPAMVLTMMEDHLPGSSAKLYAKYASTQWRNESTYIAKSVE